MAICGIPLRTALMITRDDIEQLLLEWSNVPRWVRAHISTSAHLNTYNAGHCIWTAEKSLLKPR